MVYIITEGEDIMTDLVIEWLTSWGGALSRVNDTTFLQGSLTLDCRGINNRYLESAIKVWHRRGRLSFLPKKLYRSYPNKEPILLYLKKENFFLNGFLEQELKSKLKDDYIGSYLMESIFNNKILNLYEAQKVGLLIPDSLVTSNKRELIDFYRQHHRIISKDLNAPVNIKTKSKRYVSGGVELVTKEELDALPENFSPIFVQNCVPKAYELRVFYFDRTLYTMAIFSQNDQSTQIDYRNYNRVKPNRCVPFQIPSSMETKILELMGNLKIDTCSMDIIVTPANEFVFLEINPMGQFHWLSENCNYYLEHVIAKKLSDGQIEV
nr:grasp-with-spasm system ATP-grasp peptide maturase [Allomuricauda sp.]